jgi:hypothetical protein
MEIGRRAVAQCLLISAVVVLLALSRPCRAASHALLIGITDYPGKLFPPLAGPRNDIPLVRTLLVSRLGVPEQNITTLLDAKATHTGIQKAFAALTERVQPRDFVYIHYSGHGSFTDDLNGDETQGKQDQTWVSYGATSGKLRGIDDYAILDDELRNWLIALYRKTPHVVLVSDSCHSATVTRGVVRGVRAAPPDPRPHPLGKQVFPTLDDPPGVRIGAARDTEQAIETSMDGKDYGLFTWYWVEALNQARPGETWDEVFRRVDTRVTSQGAPQRPQMQGHGEVTVLGGQVAGLKPTLPVTAVDGDGKSLKLGAGSVSGVTEGSRYRLATTAQTAESDQGPVAEVTRTDPFTSEAKLSGGSLKVGDLLEETEHAYPFRPIRLAVEGDYAGQQNKALIQRLNQLAIQLKGFQAVKSRGEADWILYVLRPERKDGQYVYASKAQTLPKSSPEQPPEVWVISPEEKLLHERMRVPLKDLDAGIATLKENLDKFARVKQLKELSSTGALNLSVKAVLMWSDPSCLDCVKLNGPDGRPQPFRKQGNMSLDSLSDHPPQLNNVVSFTVKNNDPSLAYYVYILDLTPDGGVTAIFPTRQMNQEEARINPGEERDLSAVAGLLLNTPGTEVIKLIATRDPIEARLFESADYDKVRGGSPNPLERLISEAMYTRGQAVSMAQDDWGTLQVEFAVRRP